VFGGQGKAPLCGRTRTDPAFALQTKPYSLHRLLTRSTISGRYPTLKSTVLDLYKKWKPHAVLIEESGTAIGLIEELQYDFMDLVAVKPDRDKIARMAIASAKFEAGDVDIPEEAVWLADLEAELFAFPGSRHDDQCDSISQAFNDERSQDLATYLKAYGSPRR
jgi:predicted phage terminase large subunit-like protein